MSAFTQGDAGQAASLIHDFAELGNAFAQASAFHPALNADLKVIAFSAQEDFDRYRLNAGSCAFYQQTNRGEYVVLQSLNPAQREVSFHEFTHFLLAHSNVNLPLWMNEGLADFYSTYRVAGGEVTFGGAVRGRMAILHSSPWIPLDRLFSVATNSAEYSDSKRMVVFYSESWLLAHMLITNPAYADRFPAFLAGVNKGSPIASVLQTVYGKPVSQVEQDLHEHAGHSHLPVIRAVIKPLGDSSAQSGLIAVSAPEMEVMLSDLTVTDPGARAGVQGRLADAAMQMPGSPAAEESLGFLALRQGKEDDARAHFRLAVNRGSNDANVLFYLGHLDHAAGVPAGQVMPLLERAIALKPDLNDARLELGLVAASDGKFEQALSLFQKLVNIRPENAYVAAYTIAYCYANNDQFTEARAALLQAKPLASNDHERAELGELADFINQQAQNEPAATHR